jgi:ABC-type multidrug transport system fused ATPase/permease subunit
MQYKYATSFFKIRDSINLVSRADLRKIRLYSFLQILVNFFDLVGLFLVGIIATLAFQGINNKFYDSQLSDILENLKLDSYSFQIQIAIMSVFTALIFVLKTIFSLLLTKRLYLFLTVKSADFSIEILRKFVGKQLSFIQKKSIQETIHIIATGIENIFIGIIASSSTLLADLFLLLLILLSLSTLDLTLSIVFLIYFSCVAIFIYFWTHKKTKTLGHKSSELAIYTAEKVTELIKLYKVLYTSNNLTKQLDLISESRIKHGYVMAELNFLPLVSKYIIEGSIILGTLIISAITFLMEDASSSVSTLLVFVAASTRITPAILRIQQTIHLINLNLGSTSVVFDYISDLTYSSDRKGTEYAEVLHTSVPHADVFVPRVEVFNLNYQYPQGNYFQLKNIELVLNPNEFVAFVGKSGSGKSTLVNLILGLNNPDSGKIQISGREPMAAIKKWPSKIAIVPQEIELFGNSLLHNIVMNNEIKSEDILNAKETLDLVHLSHLVDPSKRIEDITIANINESLSGGEKQRLGIARAIFSKPQLLILDEATSALDIDTELDLVRSLEKIRTKMTVIVIAHRYSTIRSAEKIVYFDKGRIVSVGSFDELKGKIANFDEFLKSE